MKCSFQVSILFGPLEQCPEDATKIVVVGCMHEHIKECPACDSCAAAVVRRADRMHCGMCCGAPLGGCIKEHDLVPLKVLEVKEVA